MKKIVLLLVCILSVHVFSFSKNGIVSPILKRENKTLYIVENGKKYIVDNRIVTVKLKSTIHQTHKGAKILHSNILDFIDISVPDSIDVEDYVKELLAQGIYETVEYNVFGNYTYVPNDTYSFYQWYLNDINMYKAWNITKGDSTIRVAVIDSGVDTNHFDLGYGVDGYSNIDTINGWNYEAGNNSVITTNPHGTFVSGIIGAKTGNMKGIAGIAGGNFYSGIKMIPYCVGVSQPNSAYIDDAIIDAVNKGAKVINLSLEVSSNNSAINAAIEYAYSNSVLIVCSSGNDYSPTIGYPASNAKTIAVGAVNTANQRADFSNYGSGLDITAPGVSIYSTTIPDTCTFNTGTSFAAPQVVGVVALMLSINPNLMPSSIKNILRNTATKIRTDLYSYDSNGWNQYVGYGLVNAYSAVSQAATYAHKITGKHLISSSQSYSIDNLLSGATVAWSLSNSYYNQNCLQQNYPSTNQCTITRSTAQDMMDATLTAYVIYNGDTIRTLTMDHIYAYSGFKGHYTSDNLSGDINYTHVFTIKNNVYTYITSPNFAGAQVTYDTGGAIPSFWAFYSGEPGDLRFIRNVDNTYTPVVINVYDVCGNYYQLYAYPYSCYLNVSTGDQSLTITLNEGDESSEGRGIDQPWTLEVRSATTGELKVQRSETSKSASVSTSGWPKGIYIVKATWGKEELTEKFVLK